MMAAKKSRAADNEGRTDSALLHEVGRGVFGVSQGLATFLVVAILIYWTEILRLVFPGDDQAPSQMFRLAHFAFYGAYIVLLAMRAEAVRRAVIAAPLLSALVALPLASYAWSTLPVETLQRAIAVVGSSLLGLVIVLTLTPRNVIRISAFTALVAAVGSFAAIALLPSVGIMTVEHPGAWAGLYGHKNGLGQMAALGLLLSLAVVLSDGLKASPWAAMSVALNLGLVIGSRSVTALILVSVVSFVLLFVGRFVRLLVDNLFVLGLVLLPILILAAANVRPDDIFVVLEAFGKDGNLSSRLPMWLALVPFIEERFWLGWGYEAFWHEANYALRVIEAKLNFRPYYAHNGLVETWLSLGAVGVGLFVVVFAQFVARAFKRLYAGDTSAVPMASFAFAAVYFIQNVSESTILMRNSMSWVLFIGLYLSLARVQPRTVAVSEISQDAKPVAVRFARGVGAKDQAAKDQAAKDQAAKDQAAKDQGAKDQAVTFSQKRSRDRARVRVE